MTDNSEKRGPVAIRIEGGRNIRIDNNVSVGMPLLHATDVEDLSGTGNRTIAYGEATPVPTPPPAPAPAKAWHQSAWFKAALSVLLAVAAGGIIYALGWN